jgi:hypothetical protein
VARINLLVKSYRNGSISSVGYFRISFTRHLSQREVPSILAKATERHSDYGILFKCIALDVIASNGFVQL